MEQNFQDGTHPRPNPASQTMVTRTTEERLQFEGVDVVHRRSETIPTPSPSPCIASPREDIPGSSLQHPDQHGSQPSQHSVQGYWSRVPSFQPGWISDRVTSIMQRLPNVGGPWSRPPRELWTLRIFSNYQNDENGSVEDSMEMQFGSQDAADNYWVHFQQEMLSSGNIVPCTAQIFKGVQPPTSPPTN